MCLTSDNPIRDLIDKSRIQLPTRFGGLVLESSDSAQNYEICVAVVYE